MKHIYFFTCLLFWSLHATSQVDQISSDITFITQPITTPNGIYFSGSNVDIGVEPYFFDGSSAPINLKDINTGISNSFPGEFYEFQNNVFFSARNTGNNAELYKTDGTSSGTILLKEINLSTTDGSFPSDFIGLGNSLIFTARETTNNPELFISDGTEAGTILLNEIQTGQFGSNPNNKTLYNGHIYFSASNGGGGSNSGFEAWMTDGTSTGTSLLFDINPGNGSSFPEGFTEHNGLLFFQAQNPVNGRELWVSDGTPSGTQLFADINPGSGSSLIPETEFFALQDKLYFEANDGINGRELWSYDSNTNSVQLVADINPTGNSEPSGFAELNGELYFSANDGVNGWELFKLNPITNAITLIDINPSGSSFANIGAVMNNRIYFTAFTSSTGRELWVTDGTNTMIVEDLIIGPDSSFPNFLTAFNGELFFTTLNGIYKFNDSVLSIDDSIPTTFNMFPNPAKNTFHINAMRGFENLAIHDIRGKLIKQYSTFQNSYNISELSAGIYFVKIKANNTYQTIKLIKN